jgi:2'-5' RNA ligase
MTRLFTALELPDAVRRRLAALRAPFVQARWIRPEDMHVTLRFVGDLSRRQQDEFARALADIDLPPPDIHIVGTGAFGGHQPRAVHATVRLTPALDALARAHDKAALACGLPRAADRFVPHVTLARLDGADVTTVAKFLERTGDLRVPVFWPQRAVLMSARDGGGAPYGVVDAFPFPGTAHDEGDDP